MQNYFKEWRPARTFFEQKYFESKQLGFTHFTGHEGP
jgi:hypothetical protein